MPDGILPYLSGYGRGQDDDAEGPRLHAGRAVLCRGAHRQITLYDGLRDGLIFLASMTLFRYFFARRAAH